MIYSNPESGVHVGIVSYKDAEVTINGRGSKSCQETIETDILGDGACACAGEGTNWSTDKIGAWLHEGSLY